MPVNVYETLLIFDANRYGRDATGAPGRMTSAVEKRGGEILASRLWEERRLAYPINGQRKGVYWLTYFRLEAGEVTGLERDFQLNDDILRALVLKVDPRIADALVEHASATASKKPAEGGPRERTPQTAGAAAPAAAEKAESPAEKPAAEADGESKDAAS